MAYPHTGFGESPAQMQRWSGKALDEPNVNSQNSKPGLGLMPRSGDLGPSLFVGNGIIWAYTRTVLH